jgi:Zn-finger nucleic acid-binding protein
VELSRSFLETDLPAYGCGQCNGIWLSTNEYLAWLRTQANVSSEELPVDTPLPISDTKLAILCPDCGHILRRYKISPDLEFHLNRCGHCNGVWFDRDEWQTLKLHNLHHQVNMFFTDPWQQKLREEEMRRRFDKMYLDKFGAENYARIKDIRAWLAEHPQGSSLLAYLTDKDPYRG